MGRTDSVLLCLLCSCRELAASMLAPAVQVALRRWFGVGTSALLLHSPVSEKQQPEGFAVSDAVVTVTHGEQWQLVDAVCCCGSAGGSPGVCTERCPLTEVAPSRGSTVSQRVHGVPSSCTACSSWLLETISLPFSCFLCTLEEELSNLPAVMGLFVSPGSVLLLLGWVM